MTQVFSIRDGVWNVQWRGIVSPVDFNSKGAALAYIAYIDEMADLQHRGEL
jgi:hypothetical protein